MLIKLNNLDKLEKLKKCLIITHPYGTLIINQTKSLVIKSKKFTTISNQPLLLIENKKGLGLIELDIPEQIDLIKFNKLAKLHKISSSDRKEWWGDKKIFYSYKVLWIKKFSKSILLDYGLGPQVTVNLSNILVKKVFVGTCGFYVDKQDYQTNSVEINHTFYKFPTENFINNLDKITNHKINFYYSIKVSRSITHYAQLKDCVGLWKKFYWSFEKIFDKIKCFIFQFSEKFIPNSNTLEKISKFAKYFEKKYNHHYIFEFRNKNWFTESNIQYINNLGIGICSLYDFNNKILNFYNGIFYLRLHGTNKIKYTGSYNSNQFEKIKKYIEQNKISESYIYFNNTDDSSAQLDSVKFYNKFNLINLT